MNEDKTRASFDQIGFVYSNKIGNNTSLRFVNFGFNYHKSKTSTAFSLWEGRWIICHKASSWLRNGTIWIDGKRV